MVLDFFFDRKVIAPVLIAILHLRFPRFTFANASVYRSVPRSLLARSRHERFSRAACFPLWGVGRGCAMKRKIQHDFMNPQRCNVTVRRMNTYIGKMLAGVLCLVM